MQMVAVGVAAVAISVVRLCRKYPMPYPRCLCCWVFAGECPWKYDPPSACFEFLRMRTTTDFEVLRERCPQALWQHGYAVFVALCLANRQLGFCDIDILDSQPECFEEPQARTTPAKSLRGRPRTLSYKNRSPASAWFCVDAATRSLTAK